MAQLEDEVLEDFLGRLTQNKHVPDETAQSLRHLLAEQAVPNADVLVQIIEATTGEALA